VLAVPGAILGVCACLTRNSRDSPRGPKGFAAPRRVFFNMEIDRFVMGVRSPRRQRGRPRLGLFPALRSSRVDLVSVLTKMPRRAARRGDACGWFSSWHRSPCRCCSCRLGPRDAQPRRGPARHIPGTTRATCRRCRWISSRTGTTKRAAACSTDRLLDAVKPMGASNRPRSRPTHRSRSSTTPSRRVALDGYERAATRTSPSCRISSAPTTSAAADHL